MAITFKMHGIEFTVPANELAEALRQLGIGGTVSSTFGDLASSQPAPLPLVEQEDGTDQWELRAPIGPAYGIAAQRARTRLGAAKEHIVDYRRVLRFLKLIDEMEGAGGADVELIADSLGAQHKKGVGSKMSKVNALLKEAGFHDLSQVYVNPREALGLRVWRAGPRLQEAIAQIEQEVSNQ